MQRNKTILNTGFTLVEMLVATAIFTSVMVVAVGALVSIINADNHAQAIKSVTDNVNFAVDNIARNLRSGTNYECLTNDNGWINSSECSGGSNEIQYTLGTTTVYYKFQNQNLSAGQGNVQECIYPTTAGGCSNQPADSGNWQSLTAPTSTANITNVTFYIYGLGSQTQQPRILITASGLIPVQNGTSTEFDIQTTASERLRS